MLEKITIFYIATKSITPYEDTMLAIKFCSNQTETRIPAVHEESLKNMSLSTCLRTNTSLHFINQYL